jgi:signal transduction histidine kinase
MQDTGGNEVCDKASEPQPRRRRRARLISRAGYGGLIALLLFSVIEAYRVQTTLSRQNIEVYREYVRQEDVLVRLRISVWQGSVYARDFFLRPDADHAAVFQSQIRDLRKNSLAGIAAVRIPESSNDEIKATLMEFWNTLEQAATSMLGAKGEDAYRYVQEEIVPRRSAAGDALRELSAVERQAIEDSEIEFAQGRRAAARQILLILGFSLLLGVAVAAYSIWRTENLERESVRNYEIVAEARRDLKRLSMRLIDIQEEERARLSRELHDEIGQILTAIRIEISQSLPPAGAAPESYERLSRARKLVERAVHTVRNISLLLRPSVLDDLGLVPALQWLSDDFSTRTGIQCAFEEEGVCESLPENVKTCAYRAVQEALHNCEKHSAASVVGIRVRQTASALDLEIEDDGRGADLGAAGMPLYSAGSGLLGMRERIAMLGGHVAIRSSTGAGLQLTLSIPLPGENHISQSAAAAGEGSH